MNKFIKIIFFTLLFNSLPVFGFDINDDNYNDKEIFKAELILHYYLVHVFIKQHKFSAAAKEYEFCRQLDPTLSFVNKKEEYNLLFQHIDALTKANKL